MWCSIDLIEMIFNYKKEQEMCDAVVFSHRNNQKFVIFLYEWTNARTWESTRSSITDIYKYREEILQTTHIQFIDLIEVR